MDDKEAASVVTVFFGVVTLAVALIPDLIGIGFFINDHNYQVLATVLGLLIIAVGLLVTLGDEAAPPL